MKRLLFLFILILTLSATVTYAQDGFQSHKFTIAGPDSKIDLVNTSIAWHKLSWLISGTASGTIALDTSVNGTTWTPGGAITGQSFSGNGSSAVVNVVANYIRMDMTALTVTAGGSVTVSWSGWVNNPAGGSYSLPTQYTQWQGCNGKGMGDGYNAIPAQTYLQNTCTNTTGVTVTITGMTCLTDNAGSSTLNAAGATLGALLTGPITCSTTRVAGTQGTNILLTAGDWINFTFVADGTSKQTDWNVTGVY
jgi:hypothetical protein